MDHLASQASYRVDLELFEGPLDLLLHLVRKSDVDIYHVSIQEIIQEYLNYLDMLDELNIDISGEFILMASELAWIKSKMLLPKEEGEGEEEAGEDPRSELIARLLKYQRYKEAAVQLEQREQLGRDVFTSKVEAELEEKEGDLELDLFALMTSFSKILARMPKRMAHEVMATSQSVSERIYEILEFFKLSTTRSVPFEELFKDEKTRGTLIVSFLAILEMCKLRVLKVHQTEDRGQIYLTSPEEIDESDLNLDHVTFH